MKLAFDIALRFLKSSKGQTALIVLGIAIGVSVQIFIGSLITGLQKAWLIKRWEVRHRLPFRLKMTVIIF